MSPAAGRAVAELVTTNSSIGGISNSCYVVSSNVVDANKSGGGTCGSGRGSVSGGSNTLVYDTIDLNNFSFARILSGKPYLETNII